MIKSITLGLIIIITIRTRTIISLGGINRIRIRSMRRRILVSRSVRIS